MRSEANVPKKWGTKSWFFLHDNAPAHRAVLVIDFLAKNSVTTLELPPYSPDLAAADFYLFLRLKSALKGRRFCVASDVIKNVTEELKRLSERGLQECFQHLYGLWQNCVVAQGNDFEVNVTEMAVLFCVSQK